MIENVVALKCLECGRWWSVALSTKFESVYELDVLF